MTHLVDADITFVAEHHLVGLLRIGLQLEDNVEFVFRIQIGSVYNNICSNVINNTLLVALSQPEII